MAEIHKLTNLQAQKQAGEGMYNDGGGLYLKVGPTGGKSWIFRYGFDGKKHKVGLGPYPTVSLAEARSKANEYRGLAHGGINPKEYRDKNKQTREAAAAKVKTFAECAEAHIEINKPGWKSPKHAQQWGNTLKTYAYPVIGHLNIADVTTDLVLQIIEPLWFEKNETASRVRGRIEAVWGAVRARGIVEGQNPAAWGGHLEHIMASRSSAHSIKHQPSMPYKDIGEFMVRLRRREAFSARALEFLILTATRTNEALEATWDEIEGDTWTIPAERMKGPKGKTEQHRIPLAPQALSILEYMKPVRNSDYIFPSNNPDKPFSNGAFRSLLERMGISKEVAVPHGFRTTFRVWASDYAECPHEVAERAISHNKASASEAAYLRTDYFDRRIPLMQNWANYCGTSTVETNDVAP